MTDTIESLDFDTRTGKLRIKTSTGWHPATAIETSELGRLMNRIKRLEEVVEEVVEESDIYERRKIWRKAI